MVSPRPQPALQPLTQHVDLCGGGHLGHSIAGGALPAPIGLLGQRSQDEATVAVHLGLALQPPAHLQNHWSALRTHAATPHQGQLQFPPHPDSHGPLLPTGTTRVRERQGPGGRKCRQNRIGNLTLAQEIAGGGSPWAEQGMSSSRPTSWKYSSLGRSRKAGGACKPDLASGGASHGSLSRAPVTPPSQVPSPYLSSLQPWGLGGNGGRLQGCIYLHSTPF